MFKFSLTFFILIYSIQLFPQIQKKYQVQGDLHSKNGEYQAAINCYRQAMEYDSNNTELIYNYACALMKTNQYQKAEIYFKKTTQMDRRRQFVTSVFYTAEMNKYLGNYEAAIKNHRNFIKKFKGDRDSYTYQKSQFEIEQYRNLQHLLNKKTEVELTNEHPVNTGHSEFGAFFINHSEMMFSSLRSESNKKKLVADSLTYYSRIYLAENHGQWDLKGKHPGFENDEKVHIANAVYSGKSEYVYFSECSAGNCKIVRARNDQGNWTDYLTLPEKINTPGSNNSQPTLARINGFDYLFFVSDRKDGYGQLDIWYSIAYGNGLYEEPVNAGPYLNSKGNDICPFYLEEEEALYFSSDWHCGMGGFDLFKSPIDSGDFKIIENLGTPFNTSYNDLYFKYLNGKGTLTSNRIGSKTDDYENCCNDLYFFEYKPNLVKIASELSNLERINQLLPIKLFFNNDQPNPKSEDTATTIIYSATYLNYIAKADQYAMENGLGLKKEEKEEAEEEIKNFFENEVRYGFEDLHEALRLLERELKSGTKIELVIKGYASPLSHSEYNKNLTLRRIHSLENEIRHFNFGALETYIQNGGLTIIRQPYGEDKAAMNISDDYRDQRNAIYSKKAAFERRVEVLKVDAVE